MGKHRRLAGILALVVLLGLAGGVSGYWVYHSTRPEYRFQEGLAALERGDRDDTERWAGKLAASGHTDEAHLLRGKLLLRQAQPAIEAGHPERAAGQLAKALDEVKQIQDKGNLRVQAGAVAGQCLLHLQNRFEAERVLRLVVQHMPDDIDAHRALAAIYFDQGALREAAVHCEEWARLSPQDGRPYRWMGHIYKDFDYDREALAAFREALRRELGPEFREDAQENLAELLVKEAEYQEALSILDNCEPKPGTAPKLLALRGECLGGLGRRDEARALLDQACNDYPNSVDVLRLRAKIHLQEEQPQPATVLLERALVFDRHDQASRRLLAKAYEKLGRPANAEEQRRLSQVTQDQLHELTKLSHEAMLKKWDAPLRRRLAELCDQLDKPELAAMWRRAAAVAPPTRQTAPN
jgi:tetratricopeptide (TPR) repeat protein